MTPLARNRRRLVTVLGLSPLAAGLSSAFASGHCGPTGAATAGPFYVRNTDLLANINPRRAPGTPMRVEGTVFGGADGRQPLAGAVVEIWHCDDHGDYHPNGSGDVSRYDPQQINLRGMSLTDVEGHYHFDSIVPGHYGNRRRHIHWRIVADGHRPLVTQSYWADERGSARERRDGVDRDPEDCRWVRFEVDGGGVHLGRFDIVLTPLA